MAFYVLINSSTVLTLGDTPSFLTLSHQFILLSLQSVDISVDIFARIL